MSRSVAYSLLSVTADDALRNAMGDDVGYKAERQKSQSISTFITDITRELVNIICLKWQCIFLMLFHLFIRDVIGTGTKVFKVKLCVVVLEETRRRTAKEKNTYLNHTSTM